MMISNETPKTGDRWPEDEHLLARCGITDRDQAQILLQAFNVELERRVRMRTLELEQVNYKLESFACSVSHDLRAPLRHVRSYLDLLRGSLDHELSDDAQGCLKGISQATAEMGRLIESLLAFCRLENCELQLGKVDLNELVKETLRELEISNRGRRIVWKLAALPAAVGDRLMLKQVLVNLLDNALKYSRRQDPAEIEIGFGGIESGLVILFIKDNGVGFDPRQIHKLFEVFQRLHCAEEFEGSGVGLANVRRIVARHGGRIWAKSGIGKGATFFFTLKPAPVERREMDKDSTGPGNQASPDGIDGICSLDNTDPRQ